ncbi:MAG: hypothetical protein ACREPG_01370 [Candidatus Binatia bacterium]
MISHSRKVKPTFLSYLFSAAVLCVVCFLLSGYGGAFSLVSSIEARQQERQHAPKLDTKQKASAPKRPESKRQSAERHNATASLRKSGTKDRPLPDGNPTTADKYRVRRITPQRPLTIAIGGVDENGRLILRQVDPARTKLPKERKKKRK